jgi:hypothetical protein
MPMTTNDFHEEPRSKPILYPNDENNFLRIIAVFHDSFTENAVRTLHNILNGFSKYNQMSYFGKKPPLQTELLIDQSQTNHSSFNRPITAQFN